MAGVISVTPEQLRQQCKVYLDCAAEVDIARSKVDAMNGQMEQQWRGEAFKAYIDQYNEICKHVDKFCELLQDVHKQLNTYANTIEERDYQDAQSFGFN